MALVQLELLKQIEKATGKKITDLFRWIVASGVSGLLMLVMVYGMYLRVAKHILILWLMIHSTKSTLYTLDTVCIDHGWYMIE